MDKLTKQPTEAWEVADTWLGKTCVKWTESTALWENNEAYSVFQLVNMNNPTLLLLIYASKASGGFLNSIQRLDIVKAYKQQAILIKV